MTPPRQTALAAAFVFAATLLLGRPLVKTVGLGHDEIWHAVPALSVIGAPGAPALSTYPFMPLMRDSYQGSLKTYAHAVTFQLFGSSPSTVRATTLFAAALTPVLVLLLVTRLHGFYLGFALACLVASDQALVLAGTFEHAPAVFMLAWKLLALWLLALWWEDPRRRRLLAAAGLCLGLGLWDKSHFLWVLAALPLAALAVLGGRLRARLNAGNVAYGALGFVLGAGPYLAHSLLHPLAFVREPRDANWPLLQHVQRLPFWLHERWGSALATLTGQGEWVSLAEVPPGLPLAPKLVLGAAAVAACAALVLKPARARVTAFWTLLALLIFAAAAASPVPVKWHHLYVLYPLPQLALASALAVAFSARPALFRLRHLWLTPLFAGAVVLQLALVGRAWRQARATGGSIYSYRGLEDVARWTESYAAARPGARIYCDDGLDSRLAVYSRGRVPLLALPSSLTAADAEGGLRASRSATRAQLESLLDLLQWAEPVLLIAEPDARGTAPGSALAALKILRLPLEPLRAFPYSDGRPWVGAYRLRNPAREAAQAAARALRAGDARASRQAVAVLAKNLAETKDRLALLSIDDWPPVPLFAQPLEGASPSEQARLEAWLGENPRWRGVRLAPPRGWKAGELLPDPFGGPATAAAVEEARRPRRTR